MKTARWYFDLISPYAYLHLKQFPRVPADITVEYVPILFAGLLSHWGQKGPAEIAPKRRYTYRQVVWLARRLGISFRMPPQHPFNPLAALRLLVAAKPDRENIEIAFDMIWKEGRDLQSHDSLVELARRLRIGNGEDAMNDATVKQRLRDNTEEAIGNGVFGVPTFLIDGEIFWGQDSLDMMLDYFQDPTSFSSPEMRAVDNLPIGTSRREPR